MALVSHRGTAPGLFFLLVLIKPLTIMANVRLIFYGSRQSGTEEHELTCFANTKNEIYISIDEGHRPEAHICLDKSTAIRFAKTLRTEINKISDAQ